MAGWYNKWQKASPKTSQTHCQTIEWSKQQHKTQKKTLKIIKKANK